jgi:hypothetical protein
VAENCADSVDHNCDLDPGDATDDDHDGYTSCENDCDDTNPQIAPNLTETCDGLDNNCDGQVDETYDQDGDGVATCSGDCDDGDITRYAAAEETCNDVDENCDGQIDEGYEDADGDGFRSCQGDCDDSLASVGSHLIEDCSDPLDNDCDNLIDASDPDCADTKDTAIVAPATFAAPEPRCATGGEPTLWLLLCMLPLVRRRQGLSSTE